MPLTTLRILSIALALATGTLAFVEAALSTPDAPAVEPADFARVRAAERARIEVVQRLMPSVVCIFPPGERSGGGSGVIIDSQGYGLTNFHVVRPFAAQRKGEAGLADGSHTPLEVLGIDPAGDVAMFKLGVDRPLYPAPLGDANQLRLGDWTLAMGNPFLLADDFSPTVTFGIVSGLHRYQRGEGRALVYTDCIQVATSINPGNSGGPLFDLRGELVGINGRISIEERARVNVGVGYAITINQIRRFIPALRAGIMVQHATLGATTRDRALGKTVIDEVQAGSAAARLRLHPGDQLIRFGGADVLSSNHFLTLLGTYPARWPVELVYERDGQRTAVRVRLDDLPLPSRLEPDAAMLKKLGIPSLRRPNPKANARAVRRALTAHQRSLGSPAVVDALERVVYRVSPPPGPATTTAPEGASRVVTEARPAVDAPPPTEPVELERWIRWAMLRTPQDVRAAGYRVVGGDEVSGRICVVVERKTDGVPTYRAMFDDDDGRLLALEYQVAADGTNIRWEYDDFRRVGSIDWPHRRRCFDGDRLRADETLSDLRAAAGGTQ